MKFSILFNFKLKLLLYFTLFVVWSDFMNITEMIIALFGGLGLFLYGMKIMGDGLENAAGDKMKIFFEKITSNPIKGVLTGAIVTAIIQSSSATTVMVVGFVNAKLMNLYQAAAVIMGANIGTTITAQLISFDIMGIVPVFLGIGGVLSLFAKHDTLKQIGHIILGFGILFLGMDYMKNAMSPLSDSPIFTDFISTLNDNLFLGILTGLVVTAIVQSSSATTGILIALASTGVITLRVAIPILFGCNIGTCVTAMLSSIGTTKTARKAALIHLLFNFIVTLIFSPFIGVLIDIVEYITPVGDSLVKRQIANSHTVFNVTNTLLLLPTIPLLVKIVNKLIPGEDEEEFMSTKYLDDRILETPPIAVAQCVKETLRMANIVKENLISAIKSFEQKNDELIKKVYEKEKLINLLQNEITSYLVKISKLELPDSQINTVTSLFNVVNDLERIGDHADNIAELSSENMQKKLYLSPDAKKELDELFSNVLKALELSIESLENHDSQKARKVLKLEGVIDNLEQQSRNNHIARLNNGECNATSGAIFLDLISNLERVGDHATNIAEISINLK